MSTSSERRLAAAILARAVRDARDGNGHAAEARRWLHSERAATLCDWIELEHGRVLQWIEGLRPVKQPLLGL